MDAAELLEAICAIVPPSGAAEDEPNPQPLLRFYPAPSILQALHPDILLVLGERGTGKTELFQVLRAGGFSSVYFEGPPRRATGVITIGEMDWGRQVELSQLFANASTTTPIAFWLALLARALSRNEIALRCPPPESVQDVLHAQTPDAWTQSAERALSPLFGWLDGVDAKLAEIDQSLVICYDQLDRTTVEYHELFKPLRGLLQLWFDQRRRWSRIRPKIFIRPDLFDAQTIAFPDGSKFFRAAQRELTWTGIDLYLMWLKRLLNGPRASRVQDWVRQVGGISLSPTPKLGVLPLSRADSELRPLVHALIGRYMGAGARKGDTYTWVPNHVQDANGRLAPRAFLTLWYHAARRARERRSPEPPPFRPEDLHFGLEQASVARLVELGEDDPWMQGLNAAFRGVQVPAERRELEERIAAAAWPPTDRPPPADPKREPAILLSHLIRRGVVAEREDGRLAVPDLYLFGLGMKRKGGIKRAN